MMLLGTKDENIIAHLDGTMGKNIITNIILSNIKSNY